ncbi:MAG: hypothetical protein PHV34_04990 [Verrucomicrobiae bacterium]|nr:hypothetical protein [Verrucomicrobiae bacterium]
MLTSKDVKEFAKKAGADLVGMASMDRFEGAPKQMDPRYIFPGAKTLIALAFRIPRGTLRGIEEGTYFINYSTMGYAHINGIQIPTTLRAVTNFLEDQGWEAVPITMENHFAAISDGDGKLYNRPTVAVSPDKPVPDVMIHFRIAAVAAGLGEIGHSNLLLTPEFGPRQRVAFILTDAPLEPDPLYEGKLCDHCMRCVKDCGGKAISAKETVEVNVAGKKCKWGKLNCASCSIAYCGGVHEVSPFLPPDKSFDLNKECKSRSGDGRPDLRQQLPFADATLSSFHHWPAIEGARGCIRACMDHLEKEDRLTRKFHTPFRTKPVWKLMRKTEKPKENEDGTDEYKYSHY